MGRLKGVGEGDKKRGEIWAPLSERVVRHGESRKGSLARDARGKGSGIERLKSESALVTEKETQHCWEEVNTITLRCPGGSEYLCRGLPDFGDGKGHYHEQGPS